MTTRVFLLRHAESADPMVFHGAESDVGLSPRGHDQARAVAAHLSGCGTQGIVSSAMRRAIDTAQPIALACGLELRLEPLLHERKVGILSGTPTGDPGGAWPATLKRWLAGQTGYAPPGAESFDDLRARLLPVWQRLTAEWAGRTLIVVAHGVVCRVLLLSLLPGWSLADWRRLGVIPNVGVSELVLDEAALGWRAERLNDTSWRPPGAV
jgi:broad specificity phosphatase PhoE